MKMKLFTVVAIVMIIGGDSEGKVIEDSGVILDLTTLTSLGLSGQSGFIFPFSVRFGEEHKKKRPPLNFLS